VVVELIITFTTLKSSQFNFVTGGYGGAGASQGEEKSGVILLATCKFNIQLLNVNYDSKVVIIGETESVKAC